MKEYLLSKEEMRLYDSNTTDMIGMSEEVLIERAACAVVNYVLEQFPNRKRRILVVVGNGNNGADGVAAARILAEYGYNVDMLVPFDEDEYRAGVEFQLVTAKYYDIPVYRELPRKEYDIIIDALFGIGLNREITGYYYDLIEELNDKNGYKISVDIPSGIDCNSGRILGNAFVADTTITFGFYKRGQFINDGPRHTGTLVRRNVGINEHCFCGHKPDMFMYFVDDDHDNKVDIGRNNNGNKGSFGKVLIIAGREDMSGACVLAAKSALRSGCGMVSVITEEANRAILLAALPEAIVHTYKNPEDIDSIFPAAEKWCDCIAIGPGIGTDDIGLRLLKKCLDNSSKPLIVDADAINVLARNKRTKIMLLDKQGNKDTRRTLIFTPHIKEFGRLSEKSCEDIKANKTEICKFFSKQYHCILVLKDSYTVVCEGDDLYINIFANDAMATAGSGDVLTGITASFLSQYLKKEKLVENPEAEPCKFPFYAAVMAVYIHSKAGLKASEMNGRSFMIASDIIEKYGELLV